MFSFQYAFDLSLFSEKGKLSAVSNRNLALILKKNYEETCDVKNRILINVLLDNE